MQKMLGLTENTALVYSLEVASYGLGNEMAAAVVWPALANMLISQTPCILEFLLLQQNPIISLYTLGAQ